MSTRSAAGLDRELERRLELDRLAVDGGAQLPGRRVDCRTARRCAPPTRAAARPSRRRGGAGPRRAARARRSRTGSGRRRCSRRAGRAPRTGSPSTRPRRRASAAAPSQSARSPRAPRGVGDGARAGGRAWRRGRTRRCSGRAARPTRPTSTRALLALEACKRGERVVAIEAEVAREVVAGPVRHETNGRSRSIATAATARKEPSPPAAPSASTSAARASSRGPRPPEHVHLDARALGLLAQLLGRRAPVPGARIDQEKPRTRRRYRPPPLAS